MPITASVDHGDADGHGHYDANARVRRKCIGAGDVAGAVALVVDHSLLLVGQFAVCNTLAAVRSYAVGRGSRTTRPLVVGCSHGDARGAHRVVGTAVRVVGRREKALHAARSSQEVRSERTSMPPASAPDGRRALQRWLH